ncbi:MAG: HAD-IIIA family hydrolase [Bacteriovoracaceae bacterium]|jgi:3-deoxy-D-manno-octulosonate 8-phosphate phosphatase (KDO 8-P phosphatase)|nr:HAD-IIIA family hydrolase [Bacteriovoracaceae bacterium]HNU75427.1 HAD-IIIA family hydrolase [Deltaproteobacteria bacterium]HON62093.1 HAD-IIIA family hydrolase [Deltaproteobacteria bacterium]HRR20406.1 HAD-IIIA family hydrolase [Desulfomonilia bacterium]HRT44530.1 HAD-IIIA family hydrolase [Desulfomonilia bacterium]
MSSGAPIRYLVLDADGVLTDCRLYYTEDGREIKSFNVRDGHGIKLLMRAGIGVAIITGRISKAVEHRAKDLQIEHVVQGAKDKKAALLELARQVGVEPGEMAYMGDDVVDLPAMALCGMSIAPGDAADMVRDRADIVTSQPGGHGAVREAAEIILKRLGLFEKAMERYVG